MWLEKLNKKEKVKRDQIKIIYGILINHYYSINRKKMIRIITGISLNLIKEGKSREILLLEILQNGGRR